METSIPRIFHQIWLQGKMPDEHCYLRDHILELHPNWEYKFWSYENMPKLKNEEIFNKLNMLMFKSDILRYEILESMGGIYIDTDFILYKNIEPIIPQNQFLVYEFNKSVISNAIMGFSKNHFIMNYINNIIPYEYRQNFERIKQKENEHRAGLSCIGPLLLTKVIKELLTDIKPYDEKFFYPFHSYDMKTKQLEKYTDSYGAHLWNFNNGTKSLEIHKTLPCYIRKQKKTISELN